MDLQPQVESIVAKLRGAVERLAEPLETGGSGVDPDELWTMGCCGPRGTPSLVRRSRVPTTAWSSTAANARGNGGASPAFVRSWRRGGSGATGPPPRTSPPLRPCAIWWARATIAGRHDCNKAGERPPVSLPANAGYGGGILARLSLATGRMSATHGVTTRSVRRMCFGSSTYSGPTGWTFVTRSGSAGRTVPSARSSAGSTGPLSGSCSPSARAMSTAPEDLPGRGAPGDAGHLPELVPRRRDHDQGAAGPPERGGGPGDLPAPALGTLPRAGLDAPGIPVEHAAVPGDGPPMTATGTPSVVILCGGARGPASRRRPSSGRSRWSSVAGGPSSGTSTPKWCWRPTRKPPEASIRRLLRRLEELELIAADGTGTRGWEGDLRDTALAAPDPNTR